MKVLFIFLCFTSFSFKSLIAIDTIALNQTLREVNGETLVSAGEKFELGFFSPWDSNKRYLGIWYKNITQQTVVWVANKDNPLNDSSGVLKVTATGNIVILQDRIWTTIWSSNSSTTSNNPFLQLLDSGNLVLKDGSSSSYIWQSFDYPCDTLLPGMKIGLNLKTDQNWYLTSWKSLQDPSPGPFTYKLDTRGLLQLVLYKGSKMQYRNRPWDGVLSSGNPGRELPVFKPIYVSNETYEYYSFESKDNSIVSRFVVNQSGLLSHLAWSQRRGDWVVVTLQSDLCDTYAQCGPNGVCNANKAPSCGCPTGFVPNQTLDWEVMDWSGGCVKKTPLNCSVTEGFRKFQRIKLPDNSQILENTTSLNPEECKEACLRNCSCVAYARTNVSGCVVWFGDLLDIKEYSEGGQELYIRMSASELEFNKKEKTRHPAVIASITVVWVVLLIISISGFAMWRRISRRRAWRLNEPSEDSNPRTEEDLELPLHDLDTIATATNNFSFTNKVGEGGFGAVYKGVLSTGQEIAVKRLSKDSGQGLKEFKNEVILIAKLQHRNLVRLLGCCIHGGEKMLIYEYMPKRSLDFYIFNQTRGTSLDWQKRFDIIVGIARGLLYLHRDSRLRIIHRDLKASNILLDHEMHPKISDFGLARSFGGDQTEANTCRVMGTYGYMSPEYAIDGRFSVKSDVFSFGVLMLEIVSGKKNRGFYHPDHDLNLLGHAWKLWNERRPMELMDSLMENPTSATEVLRCIQAGLLCVQQNPEDRPAMSSVLLLLNSENPSLPQPKKPGFFTDRCLIKTISSSADELLDINGLTCTMSHGR